MLKYVDECKNCDLKTCIGNACPAKHTPHWYCDKCGTHSDPRKLYKLNGRELCKKCVLKSLNTVV